MSSLSSSSGVGAITGYTPFVSMSVYTVGGAVTTKTFSLGPQTTPFTRPADCSSAILCQFPASRLTAGAVCDAFDFIDTNSARGVRSECYPPGYSDIFYPQTTAFNDVSTMAFPGTACMSGWTRACTQSLTIAASGSTKAVTNTQTWCCPSGWSCEAGGGLRQCRSALSTTTEVFLKNVATMESFSVATATGLSEQQSIALIRLAFPLQGRIATDPVSASTTSSSSPTSATSTGPSVMPAETGTGAAGSITTTPEAQTDGGSTKLTPGQTAGVAVGTIAGALVFLGLGIFLFFRRRRRAQQRDDDAYTRSGMSSTGNRNGLPPPVPPKPSPSSTVSGPTLATAHDGGSYGYSPESAASYGRQSPGSAYPSHGHSYYQNQQNYNSNNPYYVSPEMAQVSKAERKEMDGGLYGTKGPVELQGTVRVAELA